MKIKEIYQLIVKLGKTADPRGEDIVQLLEQKNGEYKELKEEDKKYFDQDKLFNPYSDTRILYGDEDAEVKTIMAGIDVETEVLLADRLRKREQN